MDKGVLLFLNPESTKATKKLSIETKISVSQPGQQFQMQSAKNATKPSANSISSYRLMQYQRQANTLRNASGATGGKRAPAKTKKTNRTMGVNKSSSQKRQVAEKSVRDVSVENSRRNERTAKGGAGKTQPPVHKHPKASPGKHICVLNSSVSATQPISVNINISNHLVSAEPTTASPPRKTNTTTIGKPKNSILSLSKRIADHSTKTLANTQSVRSVKAIPQFHTNQHVQKASSPPKKPADPGLNRTMTKAGTKNAIASSKPNVTIMEPHPKLRQAKTLPKQSVPISQLQSLLKSPPAAQTHRAAICLAEGKKKQTGHASKANLARDTTSSGSRTDAESKTKTPEKLKVQLKPKDSAVPVFPLSPPQAMKLFAGQLTDYEKGEIISYKEIYFMGKGIAKKTGMGTKEGGKNYGFDDDKGDYNAYVGEHVGYRYEIIDMLGKGSFGQAIKCLDHKTNEYVALKIIRSKKRFYHQATVEVKILKYIRDVDAKGRSNVVKMLDYFTFRKHICIAFELLSLNLYDFIKENNFKGLSLGLIRKFAVQILQSLVVLRQHSIIHCDLKPENILLKQPNRSGIKLIDFGSSCFSDEKIYTYIQSRFYRAPEIMLAIPYTTAIDMWSLACILAELFTGFPLFPGESEPEQMALIMEVNGLPPKSLLEDVFFDAESQPLPSTNSREGDRQPGSKALAQVLKCTDADFVDFLRLCFVWAPESRMTPEEALEHPWIVKGFPQLALTSGMQRSNGSLSLDKSESARNTLGLTQQDSHKYFSTHPKEPVETVGGTSAEKTSSGKPERKKSKPALNQSLVNPTKTTGLHSTANLISVNLAIPPSKETAGGETKLQDKLLKLKARLKLMTTHTAGMSAGTTKNAEKKRFLFNVVPKKSAVVLESSVSSTRNHKQSLKQSSIF